MPPSNPEITVYAEKNDVEGVSKCLQNGCSIDETRSVRICYYFLLIGWSFCITCCLH